MRGGIWDLTALVPVRSRHCSTVLLYKYANEYLSELDFILKRSICYLSACVCSLYIPQIFPYIYIYIFTFGSTCCLSFVRPIGVQLLDLFYSSVSVLFSLLSAHLVLLFYYALIISLLFDPLMG